MSEDIIVWGRRPRDNSGPAIYPGYVPDGTAVNGITTRPSFNNVSPGAGWSPQAVIYISYKKKCPTADASADSVKDTIEALPSGDNYEHTASIVERSPGAFSSSGQTIATMRGTDNGRLVTLLEDLPFLRGSVHNHPRSTANPAVQSLVNRYPSDEDYQSVADLAETYPQFDPSDYVLCIVDENWNVRAFPYADRANVPSNSEVDDKLAGVGLPDPLPRGSGCE